MTNTYRIKQISGEFVIQKQSAPGKQFKTDRKHATLELAEQDLQLIEKYATMSDDELFAACPF